MIQYICNSSTLGKTKDSPSLLNRYIVRHRLFFFYGVTTRSEYDILIVNLLACRFFPIANQVFELFSCFGGTYKFLEASLPGFNQEKVDDGYEASI